MRRARLAKGLLSLAAVLLTALAAEAVLRLLPSPPPAPDTDEVRLMKQDPRLGWLPREGVEARRVRGDGASCQVRINSTGQRGAEVGDRRDDELRILMLGDSFAMATQVAEESTFVALAQRHLTERTGRDVTVINGGVDGYGTYQELAYYRFVGRPLRPDIVLLFFFAGNDFRDNMTGTRGGEAVNPALIPGSQRYRGRHPAPVLRDAADADLLDPLSGERVHSAAAHLGPLTERSLLSRLVVARLLRLWGRVSGDLAFIDVDHRYHYYEIGYFQQRRDGDIATAAELTGDCLHWLHRLVHDDGAELMVVIIPSANQVDDGQWRATLEALKLEETALGPLDRGAPDRLVASLCERSGIRCLDLMPAFREAASPAGLYLTGTDDRHLSSAGHGLVAERAAGLLMDSSVQLRDPALRSWRAAQRLIAERRYPAAVDTLLRALSQHPDRAHLHLELGEAYARLDRLPAAAAAFRQAAALDPQLTAAWEGLARALARDGRAEEAARAWEAGLGLRPDYWPYREDLEGLPGAPLGPEMQARLQRDRLALIESDPFAARCWWSEYFARVDMLTRAGDVPRAIVELRRAAQWRPEDPLAYYWLGYLHEWQQEPEPALAWYRAALGADRQFEPANPSALWRLAQRQVP